MSKFLWRYSLIFLITTSCSQSPHDSNQGSSFYLKEKWFRYSNKTLVKSGDLAIDYDKIGSIYRLDPLDSVVRSKITDKIFSKDFPYASYYYSLQPKLANVHMALIFVRADDYSSLMLTCLSPQLELLDYKELTNDLCDVIEQTENKEVVQCNTRYSQYLNDSTFRTYDLQVKDMGYKKLEEPLVVDSISTDYRINRLGKIIQMTKDSVHFIKYKRR